MKEFLETEAVTGHLFQNGTTTVMYPPDMKTEFDGKVLVVQYCTVQYSAV